MNKSKQAKKSTKRVDPRTKDGKAPSPSKAFRLTEHSRFALRWIAATTGDDQTKVIEDLISARAGEMSKKLGVNWLELFHPSEAVRLLNLMALPTFKPTTQEQRIGHFVQTHAQFFFADKAHKIPHAVRSSLLWTKIDNYVKRWEATRADSHWLVAKEMAADLKRHGEPVPDGGSLVRVQVSEPVFIQLFRIRQNFRSHSDLSQGGGSSFTGSLISMLAHMRSVSHASINEGLDLIACRVIISEHCRFMNSSDVSPLLRPSRNSMRESSASICLRMRLSLYLRLACGLLTPPPPPP